MNQKGHRSPRIKQNKKLKDCAIIKIDDEDFNKTNTGVWCLPLSQIMTDTNYTGWKEYTKDTVIDDDREENI